jgi:hypothetical protein
MIDCRGKIDGDVVRLQVHRDICGHQSQRGRTAGRNPHSDPLEIGKPGEIEGSVPQEELVEEESEQEQVSGFRDRNADGKRPKLAEEVQGFAHIGQPQSQEFAGEGLGEGQQVEIVRKSARLVNSH